MATSQSSGQVEEGRGFFILQCPSYFLCQQNVSSYSVLRADFLTKSSFREGLKIFTAGQGLREYISGHLMLNRGFQGVDVKGPKDDHRL